MKTQELNKNIPEYNEIQIDNIYTFTSAHTQNLPLIANLIC